MTISIKHRSGGTLSALEVQLELAKLWHESLAEMYREKYAAVPVKVRKHRMTTEQLLATRSALIAGAKHTLHQQYLKDCVLYD